MRDSLLKDLRNPARGGGSDAYEAATEIEKLREGWLSQAARDAAEIVRLEAEIEKLAEAARAMLEAITIAVPLMDIADAALDGDTAEQFRSDGRDELGTPDDAEIWVRADTVRKIQTLIGCIKRYRAAIAQAEAADIKEIP